MARKTSRRRGKGEGSAYRRKDGRWEYALTIGANEKGNPKRVRVYGKTEREVLEKAAHLRSDFARGLLANPDGITVREFAQRWLERHSRGKAQNTIKRYNLELSQILPVLGEMKIQGVKPTHIRRVLDVLASRGIALSSQGKVLERMKVIFREAQRLELIYRNPAEFIEVQTQRNSSEPAGRALEPWEIEKLLEACETHPMGLFFRLLLATGLRKGEALALQWGDISLEQAEISITKNWTGEGRKCHMSKPKSRRSRRVVPIPRGLLARLEATYQELLEAYPKNHLSNAFVFGLPTRDRPFDTLSPNHALKRMIRRINAEQAKKEQETGIELPRLAHIRVHDLRHTYGSLALRKGMPLELVSDRMGHSTPTITLNIYRHLLQDERRGYVLDLEEMLSGREPHRA